MAYFLILPLVAGWLLLLAVGSLLLRRTRLGWLAPYGWWMAAGSALGFGLAALGWVALLYGILHVAVPQALQLPQQLTIAGVALLGPVVASSVGLAVGSFAGLLLAWRSQFKRRLA